MKKVSYFENVPEDEFLPFRGGTFLLDIDHTLLAPSDKNVSSKVKEKISQLKALGITIFLLSNGGRHERNKEVARDVGVEYVFSRYKKPNKKILEGLAIIPPVAVVGDKSITDGAFALRLRVPFLRVARHISPQDSSLDRFACFVDDVVSWFLPL